MAADSSTSNKGYILQGNGNNSGTWGDKLNDEMIKYVDINLGGIKSQALASTTPVTINAADSRNVIYRFTGTLTKDITVVLTSYVGFLIVENVTTSSGGPWTVSVKNDSVNSTAATITQGTRALLISDSDNSSPSTYGGVRIVSQTYTNLVNTFNAGTTGLTPNTATSGDITLAGTLNVVNGGTQRSSLTENYLLAGGAGATGPVNLIAPGTSGNFLTSNGTTWTSAAYVPINYGTLTASSLTTTISFANVIPSTTKRIQVMWKDISYSNSDYFQIQIGYGGTPAWQNTGYISYVWKNGAGPNASTSGFIMNSNTNASFEYSGFITIVRLDPSSNFWILSGLTQDTVSTYPNLCTGTVALLGSISSLRLITVGGTNFDKGSANITWE